MSSGSISATCAPISGVPPTLNLILRSWSVITAQSVTSLPVPAVVGIATSGGMRSLDRSVAPLVLGDRAAVARDDADRFRGVHRRAAAQPDEAVAPRIHIGPRALVDERDVRIRAHLVEDDRVVEVLERAVGEPCRCDTWIGHEHRPRDAELADVSPRRASAPGP